MNTIRKTRFAAALLSSLSLLALSTLSGGCVSLGRSGEQEPILMVGVVNGLEPGTDFSVYADGRLRIDHEGRHRTRKADPPTLALIQEIVHDADWRRQLLDLRATHDPATMPEGDFSFVLQSQTEEGRLWTRFPAEDLPEDLRPMLRKIDDLFLQAFGKQFPFYVSSIRLAEAPAS
jgi:hypothetical protein